ncbi:type IV pilus assembly protein PilZ [Candidatus Omnitrophus magneticus]|uniref:Type IV pilus assembly protein PilZ n=1 Tax=Candidatus Omnitrophus magneticus TaxID=1609969 RepID=A0A0F0CQ00_9BACT|nr:type IV pilus assembly protein PilZ [Candidatus Omnitrophus magneticus]
MADIIHAFMASIQKTITNFTGKTNEKRRFTRLEGHHLVKYRLINTVEQKKDTAENILTQNKTMKLVFAKNISEGGILFFCKEYLSIGAKVELEINFPYFNKSINAVGRIVRTIPLERVHGYDIGVEFTEISSDSREFIREKIGFIMDELENNKKRFL